MAQRTGSAAVAAGGPLSRPLPRAGDPARAGVSGTAFAFLFSEVVTYFRERISSTSDLEARLDALGFTVGLRLWELVCLRERPTRRETTAVAALQLISGPVWAQLFGRPAGALEKSNDVARAYMIREEDPLTSHYISMPKELARLNVGAYVAGIIRGMLASAGFPAESVQAVTVPAAPRDGVVFLIKFSDAV